MSTLEAKNITVRYGKKIIFNDLGLTVPTGQITVIVGPNGSGKSTLLKALTRLLTPTSGSILLDGQSIHADKPKVFARKVGVLSQTQAPLDDVTVGDLVAFGRHPHQSFWHKDHRADSTATQRALSAVGLENMTTMKIKDLSGGQRQRAWLALTLAQETDMIVLDEPTSFLDIKHQIGTMELIQKLNRDEHKTILMVLHDLNLAARVAHHIAILHEGRVFCEGSPQTVLTPQHIKSVYGVKAWVINHPELGVPQFFI